MADRAEIAVGDQAHGLFAAVIGMNPPADVGQKARGMAQPAVFLGFPQLRDPDQAVGPADQFLGMACGARQQFVQRLRGADQSVFCALLSPAASNTAGLRAHHRWKTPPSLVGRANDVFENQRRIGEQRPAGLRYGFYVGQHVGGHEAAQTAREIQRVRGRN